MRIVIVGGGEVGFSLSQALAAKHDVTVVDHHPQAADRFEKIDVQFLAGGGTSRDTLRAAGVEKADVFIACTGLDEVNIVACGMANQLHSLRTFCFVSREDFLRLSDEQEGLRSFGIDRVIWPEAQLADDIERIVSSPGAIDAEEFAGGRVRLLEYRLKPGSPLTAARVADLHLPRGALLVAVRRGDTLFIPRGSTQLAPGDKAIVMGTPAAMDEVHQRIRPGGAGSQDVVIIGGGDVGLRLAERLERVPRMQLRILEHNAQRGEMLAARLRRTLVLQGDGTDLALLEAEDVGRADVLVSVIDNDERNLFASLLGRQLGVRLIITRVSRLANLRLFERVGVDVALSARGAAVASVLHQIEGGQASLLAVLEEGAGRILELEVPRQYAGVALRDLAAPTDSIVGAILRGDRTLVPRGTDTLEAGDHLLVFSTREAADQVRTFFGSQP